MEKVDLGKVASKGESDLEQITDAQTGPTRAGTRPTLLGRAHRCGVCGPFIIDLMAVQVHEGSCRTSRPTAAEREH
jgi:hypothetical protein